MAATMVDDLDMDDMYQQDDDHNDTPEEDDSDSNNNGGNNSDSDDYMNMLQLASSSVEMVEDVGALALSLGATHLGKSLPLQAQIKKQQQQNKQLHQQEQQEKPPPKQGGIGGVLAKAENPKEEQDNVCPSPIVEITKPSPRLDSFQMIKVIGKGSFGKVFLVQEKNTEKLYALKVLKKDNIIQRNQISHVKTERNVLGVIQHPFIVGMRMAFQSSDKLYFVLDYCAGGELFFHLERLGRFPEPRARFYSAEIILALSYIHSLDIVYRDLKPENVLLDARGHIRLTDFGLSKEGIHNSSSGCSSFCGTPEYLAPEILDRKGHGRAVDWWSLGALLYEMLSGLPPFYCQDRQKLFEKIRKGELAYPASTIKPTAKNLLQGLLTKNPANRLGSGPEDAKEIQRHDFFQTISWEQLLNGEVAPPWVPKFNSNSDVAEEKAATTDSQYFDKQFTNMPVFTPQSEPRVHGFLQKTPARDNPFEGFTFTDRLFHGGRRPESD